MVLPAPVYAIKLLGWVQGVAFANLGRREVRALLRDQVTSSTLCSPRVLLAYRLLMCLLGVGQGWQQLAERGPVVFAYFTVWNWWLLTLFFLLGSWSSARAVLATRRAGAVGSSSHASAAAGRQPADLLDKAVVAMYHVVTPMALVIDVITWVVLVPSLMRDPDPERLAFWSRIMYSTSSYMQHGFNAAMVLGELVLNDIPPCLMLGAGWLALWNSAFGVWSTLFFIRTGRFIYPFLEAHRPYAWAAYVGLYLGLWVACLQFIWAVRGKEAGLKALRQRRQRRQHVRASAAKAD